jgi:hypothetical protein
LVFICFANDLLLTRSGVMTGNQFKNLRGPIYRLFGSFLAVELMRVSTRQTVRITGGDVMKVELARFF